MGGTGGGANGGQGGASGTAGIDTGGGAGAGVSGTDAGGAAATGGSSGMSGGSGPAAGAAGAAAGSSGGDPAGGSAGASSGAAGTGAAGSAGAAGSPGFSRPAGMIPNSAQPADRVNVSRDNWQRGLISPTILAGHHLNQPSIVNGYLVLGGNEEYWIYDISNPAAPRELSEMTTPNRTGGEAESHTVSFAKYGGRFYMVTTGGRGIDTWDITDPRAPVHLDQLALPGVNYGDNTNAVWGLAWQGSLIFVGATNNGIDVVDASDPRNLVSVKRVPTNAYGGVSAGPVEAVGNVLVVMTPKDHGGIATLDISDPANPVALDSFTTNQSYIGQFYRHYAMLLSPLRVWDVLTNPTDIGSGSAPLASFNHSAAEYISFSDDFLFLGHLRPDPGVSKIDISDVRNMRVTNRVWGRMNLNGINDDQFTIAFGPLLVMDDDEAPYAGLTIGVHGTDPDTKPPVVDTVIPKNGETGRSVKSRIGISFTDNIELATVNEASFIVRPMGGAPLPGKWGLRMGVVNFDPDQDLMPATTYEVVLPAGGITDLVGNALAEEFRSTFTTR